MIEKVRQSDRIYTTVSFCPLSSFSRVFLFSSQVGLFSSTYAKAPSRLGELLEMVYQGRTVDLITNMLPRLGPNSLRLVTVAQLIAHSPNPHAHASRSRSRYPYPDPTPPGSRPARRPSQRPSAWAQRART